MTIKTGEKLPDAGLLQMTDDGAVTVALAARLAGRKVAIFAVPGAFTPTCHNTHVPGFVRIIDRLRDKGIAEVICIAVNDPFVMQAWGKETGADKAGITMLADADAAFTKAIGMDFSAAPAGLHDRSKRYAMLVEDGVLRWFQAEAEPGVCALSSGEALLDAL